MGTNDESILISGTAQDGSESSLALYDDSVVVVWGVEGMPDLTINDPVYNYTNDIGSYMGIDTDDDDASSESSDESGEDGSPSSDDDAEEGFLVIIGSTDDCEVYMLAFNADAMINVSPTDDCGFVSVITEDYTAVGNEDAYVSFMEDSVMFGSTVTGSNFTLEGVTTEVNEDGDTVLTTDEGSMTFTAEGSVVFASNDPDADVLTMMNPVYNYTMGDGEGFGEGFGIMGDTEECADFFFGFSADGLAVASEDCDFLFIMTEDWTSVGNGDAFVTFMEDSMMFGSSVTGSNFTIDGLTTEENDEGETVVTSDEGTMTFASDGSVVFASNDPDADVFTMMNPVYNYTAEGDDEQGFFITGDTEECADFVYAFNADGLAVGSEDCNFLIVMTDDFFAAGNEDAFVTFMEDSVMFGSTVTGSNFTLEGVTTEVNDDGDTVLTTDEGSTTFTADNTVVFASSDPDADVFTMMNPVYNYTEEGEGGFTITGDTEECADFFLAFNADGAMVASEDCGFLAAGDADGGVLVTDDLIAF